jgi:hypothetical protein
MEYGMMWFDDNPKTPLTDKIEQAVNYYHQKYGHIPDLCFVNPLMLKQPIERTAGIAVHPSHSILLWHFWIGKDDNQA